RRESFSLAVGGQRANTPTGAGIWRPPARSLGKEREADARGPGAVRVRGTPKESARRIPDGRGGSRQNAAWNAARRSQRGDLPLCAARGVCGVLPALSWRADQHLPELQLQ